MDLAAAIGIALTIIGLLSTLIGFIIKLSSKSGETMNRLSTLERERDKDQAKFQQFYDFKSDTQTQMATMNANFLSIMQSLGEIKETMKELKK